MSKISRFTRKVVTLAKNAVDDQGETAAPTAGGSFADYAVVSLHCLRIYLGQSYRTALDWLSEMPQILAEIGLKPDELPHHSTLVKWFDRITMAVWRVLLRLPRRSTSPRDTPPSIQPISTARTPANTIAAEPIIVSRRSKRPLLWTQPHKLCLTFIVQLGNAMTHRSAGRSRCATQATCTALPLTKATTGSDYERNYAKRAPDR